MSHMPLSWPLLRVFGHELRIPQRGTQDFDPICPPHLFAQIVDVVGDCAASVPNTRLSLVKLDARVPVQRFRHLQVPHPPWLAQRVQIVQECTQSFADQQRLGHSLQSALNADREQQRHQRVTLSPSFCLRHCPPSPFVVVPIVL